MNTYSGSDIYTSSYKSYFELQEFIRTVIMLSYLDHCYIFDKENYIAINHIGILPISYFKKK